MNKIFDILRLISLVIVFFTNLICYIVLPKNISDIIYYSSVRKFVNSKLFNTKINIIGEKGIA